MIKIENVVLPSAEQWEFVIQGMRNPLNSHDRSDSYTTYVEDAETENVASFEHFLGDNDYTLADKLSRAGAEHRKYLRMLPVMLRITAPMYWWKEFDTYKIATVRNSTSTMHKLTSKPITADDFSIDDNINGLYHFTDTIVECERLREEYLKTKDTNVWRLLIQLLPSSYNQTSNIMLNYEVLANMYKQRLNHKLSEWREFCAWIETLPYSELITHKQNK